MFALYNKTGKKACKMMNENKCMKMPDFIYDSFILFTLVNID